MIVHTGDFFVSSPFQPMSGEGREADDPGRENFPRSASISCCFSWTSPLISIVNFHGITVKIKNETPRGKPRGIHHPAKAG
jgi:hypothetical protein